MVYKRRAYRKKRVGKNLAPLNVRQKKDVKRLIGEEVELKYHSKVLYSGVVPSNGAGTNSSICDVAQGQTDTTRVGDALTLKSLEFRYTVRCAGVTPDFFNFVRVIVFQWNQNTVPTAPDIMDQVITTDYESFYNHDNRSIYKIMYDRTHFLSGAGPAGVVNPQTSNFAHGVVKFMYRFPRKRVNFIAATTTPIHGLYMIALSDSTASPQPTLVMNSKITYSDG